MIEIKEFLPNPFGKDTEGEYIVILNKGSEAVSLSGLEIKDKSGKSFLLSGVLGAGKELKLPYELTKINLNNSDEILSLYDSKKTLLSELSYTGAAKEGFIVTRDLKNSEETKTDAITSFSALENAAEPILKTKTSFVFPLILTGILLAGLSLWIRKNLEENND